MVLSLSFEYQNNAVLYDQNGLKRVRSFLKEELRRSFQFQGPWVKGHPPVYYLSYLFRNCCTHRLVGHLGAVTERRSQTHNSVYCDLRVGSYRYDNIIEGGLKNDSERDNLAEYTAMPLELDRDAYRFSLWRLTDACYREATEQYYKRRSQELHYIPQYPRLHAKTLREARSHFKYQSYTAIDKEYWAHLIRKAGRLVKKYQQIKNSSFEFFAQQTQSIFLDSEGSELLQQHRIYELRAHLWLLTPKGEGINQEISLVEGDLSHLPSEKVFLEMVQERLQLILQMAGAARLNSFSGPALLSPLPSGVFFHEVVGHRLEGTRLFSPEEGATFLDLHGKRIAPEYIDIIDDPNLEFYQKRRTIGHFLYDDEGSPAQSAVLVKAGVLKNYLSTSSPLPRAQELNGHARNQSTQRPISRMGNFFVINHKPVNEADMRALLIEEIKKQKKDYGIHIKEVLGGETGTDTYDFQAFKGEILHAVRVFPNGREELVRGVDFVGTPLTALDAIICLGDKPELSNAYCGAESGIIPVSTIAPSMLLSNLELQSRDRERYTPYALPLPYGE